MVIQLDTLLRAYGNHDLVVMLLVALLLISSVAATKLIAFGPGWSPFGLLVLPIITDGGALLFPFTYVLGDVLAEVSRVRGARYAIPLGFEILLLASLIFLAVGAAPAAPGYENQEAFVAVLSFIPRVVVASLTGYLVGQFPNAWVLVKLGRWREGKGMWKRPLGSTVMGEAAGTTIFCLIAFDGQIDGNMMLNYIVVGYLFKVGVEAVLLPVTYRVISLVRSRGSEPTKVWGTASTQALELPELFIPGVQMLNSTQSNPFQ